MADGYQCETCGEWHEGLPMSYGIDAPDYWYGLSPEERDKRGELSSDQCVIDNKHFFLRGRVQVPIIGSTECFYWTVWVSLSQKTFDRVQKLWETPGRESEPPYFGWLSTNLSVYPNTINLKTSVHTRPVGERPLIELESTEHPLSIEQHQGMTLDRVRQIAEAVLHGPLV